jgi:hypothetical protein
MLVAFCARKPDEAQLSQSGELSLRPLFARQAKGKLKLVLSGFVRSR